MRLIFHFNLLLVGFVTARIAFTTYQIVFGLDLAPTFYIFIGFTGVFRWFQQRGYLHRTLR